MISQYRRGPKFLAGLVLLILSCILIPATSVRGNSQQSAAISYEDRDDGIKLYKQGDIEGAVKTLRVAVRKFKDDAIAWHYLGLSLVLVEDLKGARKAFEKSVELRPDFAPSRAAFANTLLFTRRIKDAEKQANLALSFDAQDPEAHYVLGALRLLQGSCAEALTQADAALNSHPDFPSAYLLKSQSLICDIAKTSLKPWSFDGALFRTGNTEGLSKDEKLSRFKRNALRYKEAAGYLERFLQLAPGVAYATIWRGQLEALRLHAEPADRPDAERTIFTGMEVTTKPHVLSKPEPSYTETARNAQVEGTVVLRAIFAADGNVTNILILSSLPNGLTERAINAARRIKFSPATKDGRPVSMFVQLEYNFNLY